MAFSLDHVKALLETDSVMDLESIQSMIAGKFKRPPLLSGETLGTLNHYKNS